MSEQYDSLTGASSGRINAVLQACLNSRSRVGFNPFYERVEAAPYFHTLAIYFDLRFPVPIITAILISAPDNSEPISAGQYW